MQKRTFQDIRQFALRKTWLNLGKNIRRIKNENQSRDYKYELIMLARDLMEKAKM